MRILMVCLGNICRSPLAEGILLQKIKAHNLDWKVDSAGTGGWHVGEMPDSRSIAIAQKHGLDITYQRAQQFQAFHLDEFDLILAMDTSNYKNILRMAKTLKQKQKVKMILNYSFPNENRSVPDPYYNDGFDKVYRLLEAACSAIIDQETK